METFIVLDFLPNGHPLDSRPMHLREALVQVLSVDYLTLLEVLINPTYKPNLRDSFANEDKEKIKRVIGRIDYARLTNSAKQELEDVLEETITKDEKRFVNFFNTAYPITTRLHSLELLPGIGKKHMWDIISARKAKPFESFEDVHARISLLSNPKKSIIKRILDELQNKDRYYLFIQPPLRKRW